jgi:tetratricopeptide (TPR) repeat protein
LLEQALDLDPDYVPALVQLGLALYLRANFGPAYSETDLLRNRSLIEKALTLEPDHGVANAYLGWGYFEYEKDLQKAARQLERAVQLAAGNAEVLRVASGFARRIGRFDAAVHLAGLAVERDPLCVACAAGVWGAYMEAGKYEQAIEARRRWRHGGAGSETVGLSRLYSGDASAALKEFERGEVNEFAVDALRAMALHDVGRFDESVAALASHVANWSERHGNYTAMAYAWRGDADAAFEWLRKRYWPEMRGFHREIWNPAWRKLHDDPRWTNLCQQSGYTAEKFAAVEFNPELPN